MVGQGGWQEFGEWRRGMWEGSVGEHCATETMKVLAFRTMSGIEGL